MGKKNVYKKEYVNYFDVNKKHSFELTEKQEELVKLIKEKTITFVKGCWGTGKSYTSCYAAYDVLGSVDNKISKCIITKPIVESGDSIGFLKGDMVDKIAPYAESYWSTFEDIADDEFIMQLRINKELQFKPVNYMRGINMHNSVIILDEAQNFNVKEMITFITRMGNDSKMILVGDHSQSDIPEKKSAFKLFWDMLQGMDDVGFFEFDEDDIKRNPILIEITKRYNKWKESHYIE